MSEKIVFTKIHIGDKDLLLCGRMRDRRLIEARLTRLPDRTVRDGEGSASPSDRILGNIYIGKVQRVVKNLHAAFVEIAPGFPCYLSLEHVRDPILIRSSSPGKIVQDDELLVQVTREARGTKGPSLSTNLNFTGRYAVLTTENRRLGVSSKLSGAAREHCRKLLQGAVPEGCGLIVRTNAQDAPDGELLSEIGRLKEQMDRIIRYAASRTCFSCLYRPEPVYPSYLKGAYSRGLDEILTDLPDVCETLKEYCGRYSDLAAVPLRLWEDPTLPLADLLNLNREITRALAREVRLKSGGFLVIDPTEAMTVIDVNTGKSAFPRDREEHFLKINLEASREIALQLRLRNLSGIVIVDYIDLESAEHKRELLEDLRLLAKEDPVPVEVHDITALGLVEITRKKVEKSLSEQIKQLTMKNPLC